MQDTKKDVKSEPTSKIASNKDLKANTEISNSNQASNKSSLIVPYNPIDAKKQLIKEYEIQFEGKNSIIELYKSAALILQDKSITTLSCNNDFYNLLKDKSSNNKKIQNTREQIEKDKNYKKEMGDKFLEKQKKGVFCNTLIAYKHFRLEVTKDIKKKKNLTTLKTKAISIFYRNLI